MMENKPNIHQKSTKNIYQNDQKGTIIIQKTKKLKISKNSIQHKKSTNKTNQESRQYNTKKHKLSETKQKQRETTRKETRELLKKKKKYIYIYGKKTQ